MYEGRQGEPLTLHKYGYAHNNPVNSTDPTGFFTLTESNAAHSIRNILSEIQLSMGGSLANAAEKGGDYGILDFLQDFGPTSFALFPILGSFFQDVLSDASLLKKNKSQIYEKDGDFVKANEDFDNVVASSGATVKDQGNGIRSAELPDGTKISVRPDSSDGRPTIQINKPKGQGKPIKVRYK